MKAVRKFGGESLNRDECRTPMQWDTTAQSGFSASNSTPWVPITPSYRYRNVRVQTENNDSLLNCYKRFLKIRKETPALHSGSLVMINSSEIPRSILSYIRSYSYESEKQIAIIYLNMSDLSVEFRNPHKYAVFSESTTIHSKNDVTKNVKIHLFPWEGVIYIA